MHSVGLVLHPQRDSAEAVEAVLGWASKRGISVYGIADEIVRLNCAALPVTDRELGRRADLIVSLGGDGTMLRAMRLADGQRATVLGVNLGKLGFLAEVDVPDLPDALSAIDAREFTIEPRLAIDATFGGQTVTAFNDVAVVRVPGNPSAVVVGERQRPAVRQLRRGRRDRRDARPARPPTASPPGGPIVQPAVEALLVTPAAPHSAYNRGFVLSVDETVELDMLPSQRAAGRRGRRPGRGVHRARRPGDDAGPAAGRAGHPARPHHVLPARPAQAPAHRLRRDPADLRRRRQRRS